MPHIIIEHTVELAGEQQIESMLDALHATLAASGLFDEDHIRLRTRPLHHYRCGGQQQGFIHAQLRIHAGRSSEQKRTLSHAVLQVLQEQRWPAESITVEVVEMERESYAKFSAECGA